MKVKGHGGYDTGRPVSRHSVGHVWAKQTNVGVGENCRAGCHAASMPPLQGSKAVALSKALLLLLLLLLGRRHALLLLGRRALPVEAAGAAGWATKLHRLWGHAGLVGGWSKAKAWGRRPLLHARRGPHGTARKPGDARRRRLLVAKAWLLHGRCLLEAKPWLLLHGRPLLVPKPWLLHGRGLLIAKPWLLLHRRRLLVPAAAAAGGLPAIREG